MDGFVVLKTGGKQYLAKEGSILKVEKLAGNVNDVVFLEDIVYSSNNGVIKVEAKILDQYRDDKVIIFKKKRRKNYRRKNGHRQHLTMLKIVDFK